ncbi:hypothetical protein HK141_06040 [Streptococcus agalactiae]|nr:hypothetical protein [Streptococcus agalactiae]
MFACFIIHRTIVPYFVSQEVYYNDEWPFDIFDDMDSYTFLYTDIYIEEDSPYHFKNWFVPQFYL